MTGKVLFSLLEADGTLTTLLGKRIFPLRVPQGEAYPAATYQIISNVPTNRLQITSGLDKIRVQINVFAPSYSDLEAINAAIRRVLDGYKSNAPGSIGHIYYGGERDLYAEEALVHSKATDYFIQLRR